jgi:geranylgeranylglycerol-phosphate geranylgeranyltransferase
VSEQIFELRTLAVSEHRRTSFDGERLQCAELRRAGAGLLQRVAAVARLVRLNSGITSAAGAILTASMVAPAIQPTQMALIAAVVVTLSNGGYALNDICDRAIDKINQPGRPIPAGRISVPHALLIGSGSLVAAVLLALPLSRWCIALTLTDAALLGAYAVWSKRLGPLKNILIGYLVASGFLIGAYNWDRIDPVIAVLAACAFFGTIAREMVKDVQDIEGDRYHGARTLPIMFGPHIAYVATSTCLAVCLILAAVPYVMGLVNNAYMALLLVAVGVFLIGWRLRHASARLCQYMIMAGSIVVLVAFAIGHV